MKSLAILLTLLIITATVATAEPSISPLEDWEIYDAGQVLKDHYPAIIRDGQKVSDGRCFIRGFDLHLSKWCLYVINPDGKVERHEYQTKKEKGHGRNTN